MNFKDWCIKTFGIAKFTEGKILNSVFIPAFFGAKIVFDDSIKSMGAYLVDSYYMRGIIINYDSYQQLKKLLLQQYSAIIDGPYTYNEFLTNFFNDKGLNLSEEGEYKEPSNVHITFGSADDYLNFLIKFKNFNPRPSFNLLLGKESLEFRADFVNFLLQLYYQSPEAEVKNQLHVCSMQDQVKNLQALKHRIEHYNLFARLDSANILSKDFTNSIRNRAGIIDYQAISAYAISLNVYAEVNRDNLSEDDYNSINYTASLLAAYDKDGHLKQSLKTDSKFIFDLNYLFIESIERYFPRACLINHLPYDRVQVILHLINKNLLDMLYGNPSVSLANGTSFRMLRFVPTKEMYSETDELVFQGGGSAGHSATFRIIKVGILANGSRALFNETPLFYLYYKVEDNLGEGCHDMNVTYKTCLGTYITQLHPITLRDGQIIPADFNPYTQPEAYQQAIETTLRELIWVERQLVLYRRPKILPPDFSTPEEDDEANEWIRLNKLKIMLSGTFYPFPIYYYAQDPLDPSKKYQRSVRNQRNFMQEGGSCPIFTLKSLASSIIDMELTTLHTLFMQLNDARGHLLSIDHRINELTISINKHLNTMMTQRFFDKEFTEKLQPQSHAISHARKKVLFFGGNQRGIEILKNLNLNGARWIRAASWEIDENHNKIIRIRCLDVKRGGILARAIEAITTVDPKLPIKGKELLLEEERMMLVCEKLNISYNYIMNSLEQRAEATKSARVHSYH